MAHPEEVALYRAILADPHEDTARLVYADWLQENAEPAHADLIRTQCRLARTPPWGDGYAADRVRSGRLLRELGTRWCRAPGAPGTAEGFPTGFFVPSRGLAGGATAFLDPVPEARARDWFAHRPIASARFYFDPSAGDRRWLLTTDALPALRTLWLELGRFCPAELRPAIYRTLAETAARADLTRLELNGPVPSGGLERLVRSAHLPRLEVLSLTGSDFSDEQAFVLARKTNLPALRELTLSGENLTAPELTPAGAAALGRADWVSRLTAIRLGGHAALGGDGLKALLGGTRPDLRTLEVRNCHGAHPAVAELVAGPGVPGLRELAVSGQWAAAHWKSLTGGPQELLSLTVWGHLSTGRPAKAFFDRPALRDLRRLELFDAELEPPALGRLVQSPLTESLRWLTFKAGDKADAIGVLLSGRPWPHLEYLQIDNTLSAESLLALIASDRFPRLVGIKAWIGVGADGFVERLSKLPAAARLRELDLGRGLALTPRTATALADSPHLGDIDRLYVSSSGAAAGAYHQRLVERYGARVELV
ncbi:hypothetical protein GobsT_52130 [Gemmata obscuriglobus]|uniref:TIGR02996 domain-containing protein n=1 Tax=Gemmata obscuriglobus TaxID=114 RepID=UPI00016C3838|nr:TIGR02996 domain-containing protein [Gemmata obscuriglobus]QEG30408.1 hypothetical protein GobsT_52130 [Gemmata obscuriglobus]VTS09732.1 Repeat-companion domain protein OS=Isosphaera pallida (strain ATCC 43644 / DSM 9630 / IS1B) GN=Isop_0391 PE=4 SV=1 [Gemmata obscuriglobus UQM 2246]